MKLYLKISLGILLIVFFGCSSSKSLDVKKVAEKVVEKKVNQVDLEIEKIISWVNLMPGPNSENKFQVSGKFFLLPSNNYDYNKTNLKYIKVYQNGKQLYFIQPKVIEKIENNKKEITYSTIKGLSINQDLNSKKKVEMEFIFNSNGDELKYYVENIKIEEAY